MNHPLAIKLRKIAEHYATEDSVMRHSGGSRRWPKQSSVHIYRQMKKLYLAGILDLKKLDEVYLSRVKGRPTVRQAAARKLQSTDQPKEAPIVEGTAKKSFLSRLFKHKP